MISNELLDYLGDKFQDSLYKLNGWTFIQYVANYLERRDMDERKDFN